jgi:hypothetical protein
MQTAEYRRGDARETHAEARQLYVAAGLAIDEQTADAEMKGARRGRTTMDLKTFITETLQQICDGIREAQRKEGGGAINAEGAWEGKGHLFSGGGYGIFTRVDFDVAVSAETGSGGKGSIKVFGVGAEGGAEHKTAYANRITFAVPVKLPDGDKHVEDVPAVVTRFSNDDDD